MRPAILSLLAVLLSACAGRPALIPADPPIPEVTSSPAASAGRLSIAMDGGSLLYSAPIADCRGAAVLVVKSSVTDEIHSQLAAGRQIYGFRALADNRPDLVRIMDCYPGSRKVNDSPDLLTANKLPAGDYVLYIVGVAPTGWQKCAIFEYPMTLSTNEQKKAVYSKDIAPTVTYYDQAIDLYTCLQIMGSVER